jgi:hypothetical protein
MRSDLPTPRDGMDARYLEGLIERHLRKDPGILCASIDLPEPGGPVKRRLGQLLLQSQIYLPPGARG